jgi:hypothetical protein
MKAWMSCVTLAAGFGVAAWAIPESHREEKTFRDLLRGLTFGRNPGEVLRRIAERATLLVGGTAAYVERLEFEHKELIAEAAHNGYGLPAAGHAEAVPSYSRYPQRELKGVRYEG